MDLFGGMLSQILGGLGGGIGGGGSLINQAVGPGAANPFGDITGTLSSMIGGPGSESGTLFSLPNEMLTGIADLGTSKDILGDVMNLTKPIENIASSGLGGLGGLNPFGLGGGGSGRLGGIIPHHYLPILGLGALTAALERPQEEEY